MGLIEDNKLVDFFYQCMFLIVVSYAFFGGLSYVIRFNDGSLSTIAIGLIAYSIWIITYLLRLAYRLKTNDYVDKVISDGLPK
jgi:hypothetical protein